MKSTIGSLLLLYCLAGIAASAQAENPRIVFGAQWLPQAQFAGYYVAKDQGFYQEAGVDVEIIHPSTTVNTLDYLTSGRADVVSLFLITAMNARFDGHQLVNIGQLSQHSAIMFVSRKESGLERIEDFEGKRIGVWMSGFQEIPYSLMAGKGVDVEWVPILSSVNLFLMGGLDAMTVMWYNEYKRIYLSGINHEELNTFFMADYDYDIPEDGLYALAQTREEKKEELRAFAEATLRGWQYASVNREYTLELVIERMREANIPASYAHQRWMLDKILDQHGTEGSAAERLHLHKNDFGKAYGIAKRYAAFGAPFVYEAFFKPVIVPDE